MTRSRTRMRAATTALAAATLLLAACSSAESAAASADWVPGPLDEFQARIFGWSTDPNQQETQQEAQARMDADGRRIEELVAACMAEYGFTYIPRDDAGGTVIFGDELDVPWGTREFAETYGFGVVNDPWNNREEQPVDEPIEWFDPNQETVDAMSDAERDAWNEALWGPPQEDGEWDPMQAGCQGRAQHEVHNPGAADEQFAALQAEMDTLWERMQTDPRITAVNAEWASCMADAGHPGLPGAHELNNLLWEEWRVVQRWDQHDEIFMSWDWEANPDGPTEMPEPDPAEVAAFAEREIALAVADFDCRQSVDFETVFQDVNHDLQQQFVDRHRAELEAWAEHAEARRDG